MSVGRNELCPCGSGKKYKKCCGIVTPISQFRGVHEQKLRKEYTTYIERLNNFVSTQVSGETLQKARERFANEVGLSEQAVMSPEWTNHFLNWYVLDVQTNGNTLVESFIKQHAHKMENDLRRSFLSLSLGLYEVQETEGDALTVRDLVTGDTRYVLGLSNMQPQVGQILVGRLLNLGLRDLLFSGSLILQARMKPAILEWLASYPQIEQAKTEPSNRTFTTSLYKLILQMGETNGAAQDSGLIRRVYSDIPAEDVRDALKAHGSFELKKRNEKREVWVYATRKEQHLFPALGNALLELHEVLGEVVVEKDNVLLEGFHNHVDEMAAALSLTQAADETMIQQLTSTGTKLTKGTVFITSEPTLSPKVLQWAVQTYFAEKWLVTPHDALTGLAPTLVAASGDEELRAALTQLVEHIEHEGKMGQGLARYMRIDQLRPRLALPNEQRDVDNLLNRPLIEGLPDSVYTVQPARLAQISGFVHEMTEGKSESTVKKYDEVMSLFRTFVRGAFGPSFTWDALRREELAYFLVHYVLERIDNPTKTLATNLLSVLGAFIKWLDKQTEADLTSHLQPLLNELKEDLPEAYRLRTLLQKEAFLNVSSNSAPLRQVSEDSLLLLQREENGWICQRENGETILLMLEPKDSSALAPDWLIAGLIGQQDKGWQLYGTPELIPPAVSQLLGVPSSTLV